LSLPYLDGALRGAYDAWQERALARFLPPLTFQELRRGVQALSSLYVERRGGGDLASRSLDGAGKRAAFACFYAPLHFLTLFHALRGEALGAPQRIVDVGCGTGAAGAALACGLASASSPAPRLLALDRSGFALAETRHTHAAFGLRGATRRGSLPGALPELRAGDLAIVAWCANELAEEARSGLLAALLRGAAQGAGIVVAEPLATGAAPWWRAWVSAFEPAGGRSREARARLDLPDFLARLDRAAGLRHEELGARVLVVPGAGLGSRAPKEDEEGAVRAGAGPGFG
jgi:SAM-dependent methyltransferase